MIEELRPYIKNNYKIQIKNNDYYIYKAQICISSIWLDHGGMFDFTYYDSFYTYGGYPTLTSALNALSYYEEKQNKDNNAYIL
jgi:hypothetical protein